MNLNKIKKFFSILYLIVGCTTILEFLFIQGMFTAPFMMLLVAVVGIINIVMELIDKKYIYALNYLVSSIALCMGYINLM